MEARVITLFDNEYSKRVAQRCVDTARDIGGIHVEAWAANDADEAQLAMAHRGLRWTWGKGGAGLKHHSYGGNDNARIGCALSHYSLWNACAHTNEPFLILEHDAVFLRPFKEFEFKGICQINDPAGATPRGEWWSQQMIKRGPGVWPKKKVLGGGRPDGLAGNSAYIIKPSHAKLLIDLVKEYGLWPNDAIMCRQLVPDLEEHYPFITKVDPEMSTI